MRDVAVPLRRLATSWRGDLVLAVIVVAWTVSYLGWVAAPQERRWPVLIVVLPYAAALAVRRRWPVAAAVVACGALLVVLPLGLVSATGGALTIPFSWTPFLLAYSLGVGAGAASGLVCALLLAVSLQLTTQGSVNPIFEMMIVSPWLAGRIMLSRRKLTEQLEMRNDELLAEQELFAQESRARYAARRLTHRHLRPTRQDAADHRIAKVTRVYPSAFTVGWMKLFSIICRACDSAVLISGPVICGLALTCWNAMSWA